MAFLALVREVIRGPKPGHVIKTGSDRGNSFFENETIFVLITPRSRANLYAISKLVFLLRIYDLEILRLQTRNLEFRDSKFRVL